MGTRMVLVGMAVCLAGVVGCCRMEDQLRREKAGLAGQLNTCVEDRAALVDNVSALEAERTRLLEQVKGEQDARGRAEQVVEEMRAEQGKLEQQRGELQKLVQGLSGISVETRSEGNFIVLENEILFDPGSIDLSEKARASLDRVSEYLAGNPGVTIRVDGHTDGVAITHSDWKDNYHLSAMRAHAVMAYLVQKGLDPSHAYIVGFGPNRPVVTPTEPTQDVPKNRRVEILVVPEGGRSIDEILKGLEPPAGGSPTQGS